MHYFVPERKVGCFFPTSSPTQTEVVSCSELTPVKQANTTSAFNRSYPSHFCIQNYHSALAQNFFTSFIPQSANLFFWDFAGGRVRSDNRHNQRKQNEVHAFVRALVFKARFHLCCNGNFFVEKDILLKSLFRSCFQMENLIFLLVSLI